MTIRAYSVWAEEIPNAKPRLRKKRTQGGTHYVCDHVEADGFYPTPIKAAVLMNEDDDRSVVLIRRER